MINWFAAGAAHPNYHFQTYNFILEPVILIKSLESIFFDSDEAFKVIQSEVREQLYQKILRGDVDVENEKFSAEWIDDGTKEWKSFGSFVFEPDGVEFLFAPYQVAPFVQGGQSAKVPYQNVVSFMKTEYVSVLEIEGLV